MVSKERKRRKDYPVEERKVIETRARANYRVLLAALAVVLMLLPFVNLFNELLTQLVEQTGGYKWIELYVTPHLIKVVIVVLRLLGIAAKPGQTMFLVYGEGRAKALTLSWNCLGWQSLVIFGVSLATGFQGRFTRLSKIEAVVVGLLGTFLLNIARIVFLVLGIIYANQIFVHILHDYLAVLATVVWLIIFWWYVYKYVLVEKVEIANEGGWQVNG
jgi:exosortase/archaeosortase family protein